MKRSKFNLSYTKLFSCDMGELIPCGLTEVLPGDSIQGSTSALVRAAPLLSPVMHPTHVRIHHWFVPHRLVWDDWENFITGGPDGLNASVFPTIDMGAGAAIGSLADYLGVPTGVAGLDVSALPFRGYAKIWNDWYRDQDLQTALTIDTSDGVDSTTNTTLQNCAWEKDYFTSARPWEQKGASISIPIAGEAPVKGFAGNVSATYTNALPAGGRQSGDTGTPPGGTDWSGANPTFYMQGNNATDIPNVRADLSAATGVSVNALRASMALQRFQEARARYGSRYVEYLAALGVRSSDARLQRPEYLGGGKQTIQFSEVLATAETGTSVDVGDMKGHGIAALRSNRFRYFAEEHGYIHTFMSVRPKTIYQDGLFRHWNRRTKTDFWQKELQHIGQQAVLNKEVYAAHATPDGTFGYQDRYDEYRRAESLVSGEFRDTLDFWHMARQFASDPSLNSTFVSAVPADRVFAVPSADTVYVHARNQFLARRLLSASGNSFIF